MTGDILKAFDRGFVESHLFPSGVLATINLGMCLAGYDWKDIWSSLRAESITVTVLAYSTIVTFVAFVFYLVQTPIIKMFAGQHKSLFAYLAAFLTFLSLPLFCCLQSRAYLVSLSLAAVAGLIYKGHECWRMSEEKRYNTEKPKSKNDDTKVPWMRFLRNFSRKQPCLPTRLGNIVNGYEDYPSETYDIDSFTFWYRLVGVIPEGYQQAMGYASASFLAVLNLAVVSYIASAEFVAMAILRGDPRWLVAGAVGWGVGWAAYRYSCHLAKVSGEYFRSAFDLYRLNLLRQLGVTTEGGNVITLAAERDMWGELQNITWFSDADDKLKFRLDREGPSNQAGPKP